MHHAPAHGQRRGLSLTGNQLKLLALLSMTLDHIGLLWLDNWTPFRIAGRLAFPIFSFMIAEGCRYTRNKRAHFLWLLGPALVFQLVYYLAMGSLYQSIFTTFVLSVPVIYGIQYASRTGRRAAWCLPGLALVFAGWCCIGLPRLLPGTDFAVDYGFWGVLLPVFASLSTVPKRRLCLTALGLILLSCSMGGLQVWSLCALVPLALYDGTRGARSLKYLFYVYYPLHLVVIQALAPLVHALRI